MEISRDIKRLWKQDTWRLARRYYVVEKQVKVFRKGQFKTKTVTERREAVGYVRLPKTPNLRAWARGYVRSHPRPGCPVYRWAQRKGLVPRMAVAA